MLLNTEIATAKEIAPGDTIIERFSTGSVRARTIVVATAPCRTDLSNIHIVHEGGKQDCYFRDARVELKAKEGA